MRQLCRVGARVPELYLRQRRKREAVWVILDHGHEISTGAGEGDIGAAEKALRRLHRTQTSAKIRNGHPVKS